MKIICTEYEMKAIKDILRDTCPFDSKKMVHCGEDADCHRCFKDNVEFEILEGEEVQK